MFILSFARIAVFRANFPLSLNSFTFFEKSKNLLIFRLLFSITSTLFLTLAKINLLFTSSYKKHLGYPSQPRPASTITSTSSQRGTANAPPAALFLALLYVLYLLYPAAASFPTPRPYPPYNERRPPSLGHSIRSTGCRLRSSILLHIHDR